MILGSGNIVHNLGRLNWKEVNLAFDWAERFDDAMVDQLAEDPSDALRVLDHPDAGLALPTPDHFIPFSTWQASLLSKASSPSRLCAATRPKWQDLTDDDKADQARKMEIYAAMVENAAYNLGRCREHS